jgi:phospholipase/carboxylesterase
MRDAVWSPLLAPRIRLLPLLFAIALYASCMPNSADQPSPNYLVVLLHGVGADGKSIAGVGRVLGFDLPHCEFVSPDGFHAYDNGGVGRQWFSIRDITDENRPARLNAAGAEVSAWIDTEVAKRKLGPDHVIVIGFSQGAIVAGWLAVHRTPRPAAIAMLSGRVALDGVLPHGAPVQVFMGHGDQDKVISIDNLESGAKTLEATGAIVTRHVYPGLAHGVDPQELEDLSHFLSPIVRK